MSEVAEAVETTCLLMWILDYVEDRLVQVGREAAGLGKQGQSSWLPNFPSMGRALSRNATLRCMDASFWLALASLLIGGGGLVVAIIGYLSNRKSIEDTWVREWAAQQPLVYPLMLDDWISGRGNSYQHAANTRLLPLKNGGRGPALNVHGTLVVTSRNENHRHQILASTIAAGDFLDARLAPRSAALGNWNSAADVISYADLAGGSWEQRFSFNKGLSGQL